MTNNALARILEIDAQMAAIDKVIKRGGHVGAGLTITVRVGAERNERPPDLRLELSCQTEELLMQMRASLVQSRSLMLALARADLRDLEALVSKQRPGPHQIERGG